MGRSRPAPAGPAGRPGGEPPRQRGKVGPRRAGPGGPCSRSGSQRPGRVSTAPRCGRPPAGPERRAASGSPGRRSPPRAGPRTAGPGVNLGQGLDLHQGAGQGPGEGLGLAGPGVGLAPAGPGLGSGSGRTSGRAPGAIRQDLGPGVAGGGATQVQAPARGPHLGATQREGAPNRRGFSTLCGGPGCGTGPLGAMVPGLSATTARRVPWKAPPGSSVGPGAVSDLGPVCLHCPRAGRLYGLPSGLRASPTVQHQGEGPSFWQVPAAVSSQANRSRGPGRPSVGRSVGPREGRQVPGARVAGPPRGGGHQRRDGWSSGRARRGRSLPKGQDQAASVAAPGRRLAGGGRPWCRYRERGQRQRRQQCEPRRPASDKMQTPVASALDWIPTARREPRVCGFKAADKRQLTEAPSRPAM